MSLFGSAAGAIAGGVSSIIGGALSNSAARVAPRRGAWIEIIGGAFGKLLDNVAPRRGAWIEI